MAGKINQMISGIIETRSKGNPTIEATTRTKLILKGINPDKFTPSSDDDPIIIEKIEQIGKKFREYGFQVRIGG